MALQLAAQPFMTVEDFLAEASCAECFVGDEAEEEVEALIEQASDIIANLTGMRVAGQFSVVARPCREGLLCDCLCTCCRLDAVPLGDSKPTIEAVFVDGVELDPDEYDLHWGLNGWNLVRTSVDGVTRPQNWPSHQARWKNEQQTGTFAIHMTIGVPVDQKLITDAVIEIVCMLWGSGTENANTLPAGVVQAQLGGTTVAVDPDADVDERLAGGAALARLMAVWAPTGRETVAAYAPELTDWDLGLRLVVA